MYEQLKENLSKGIVCFEYEKSNGEVRKAIGTANLSFIPEQSHPKTAVEEKGSSFPYYDFAKKDWRSVKSTNVKSIIATSQQ